MAELFPHLDDAWLPGPGEDPLEARAFYELMQAYRHAPFALAPDGREEALVRFERVKAYVRHHSGSGVVAGPYALQDLGGG